MEKSGGVTSLRPSLAEVRLEPGVSLPARDSGLELGFMSGPRTRRARGRPSRDLLRVGFLL